MSASFAAATLDTPVQINADRQSSSVAFDLGEILGGIDRTVA
jgi:hypothetical protein